MDLCRESGYHLHCCLCAIRMAYRDNDMLRCHSRCYTLPIFPNSMFDTVTLKRKHLSLVRAAELLQNNIKTRFGWPFPPGVNVIFMRKDDRNV